MGGQGGCRILVSLAPLSSNSRMIVCSPADIQLERLMQRDGSGCEDASSRLNSQMPIDEKAAYADDIINNSDAVAALEEKVSSFAKRMNLEAGWTWVLSWVCPPFALISGGFCLARRRGRKAQKVTR